MSEIISCTHKVTLDIAKRDVHMIQVIYGDTANILEVNLCENGKEIPLENATLATITYSNNTFDEMQISEDYTTASVRINANCLKQGLNFAQISIYSGDNGLITADMLTIDCNQKIGGENPSCPNADMPKLKELINQLIQQGIAEGISPEQIADAVANYLAKNPIEETDPNVHEWAKAEEKPTYTAAEVGALSAETLKPAVDLALAQAKASGEFDGADGLTPTIGENGNWYLGNTDTGKPSRGDKGDTGAKGETGATGAAGAAGKSAYEYAQDGGYTGTEAEFAEKMAAEMPTTLPNPNALTFTGAVEGSYDGSAPVSVKIPEGGGEKWETILDLTLEEDVNKVVLMSGDVGYKKIMVYMESIPPTDQTVTSNQAISVYSGETDMLAATAKLNSAYLYNGNRLSGASIELTPYAANVFASGVAGWYDTGTPTEVKMGYSSENSLSKPIKELTAQVWGNALFGVGSWFKVYGVRV